MQRLRLTDILVTFVIAIVFGILYHVWNPLYDLMKPFGFHAEQLLYGFWFMAATVAFLIVRKPGVALLAELAAACFELFFGVSGGAEVFLYGLVQGLLAEAVLALFRYRPHLTALVLAGIASAVGSLGIDWVKGYLELETWNVSLLIGFRLLSATIFTGFIAYGLVKSLQKIGALPLMNAQDQGGIELEQAKPRD
jgi:energy-coupling factor transport system permease protein